MAGVGILISLVDELSVDAVDNIYIYNAVFKKKKYNKVLNAHTYNTTYQSKKEPSPILIFYELILNDFSDEKVIIHQIMYYNVCNIIFFLYLSKLTKINRID